MEYRCQKTRAIIIGQFLLPQNLMTFRTNKETSAVFKPYTQFLRPSERRTHVVGLREPAPIFESTDQIVEDEIHTKNLIMQSHMAALFTCEYSVFSKEK